MSINHRESYCTTNESSQLYCSIDDTSFYQSAIYCASSDSQLYHDETTSVNRKENYCGLLCITDNVTKKDQQMASLLGFSQHLQFNFSKFLESEKMLEELRTGLYPLTTMDTSKVKIDNRIPLTTSLPTKSPESKLNNNNDKNKKEDEIQTIKEEEEEDSKEIRRIIQITCAVKSEDGSGQSLALLLRFEDKMNRQLSCTVGENETALDLANELVQFGLINELDRDIVTAKINENLTVPA